MSFSRPGVPWTPIEVGAAVLFAIAGGVNLVRFGVGPSSAAGFAAAAAVLLPRQGGASTGTVAWYLAPIAMVALQAKLITGCPTCSVTPFATVTTAPWLPVLASFLALSGIIALGILTLANLGSTAREALAACVFLLQAILILVVPSFCLACLLATLAVAALAAAEGPPPFARHPLFARMIAGIAGLSLITGVLAWTGRITAPNLNPSTPTTLSASDGLDRLNVPDQSLVVIGSPDCPACRMAEAFLARRGHSWPVRYPCPQPDQPGCWTSTTVNWTLPTVLRREGQNYRVVARGFLLPEWEALR